MQTAPNTPTTPWHRASFDHFLYRSLPDLLTDRLGLSGYRAEIDAEYTCRIALEVRTESGPIEVEYPSLPAPDEDGVFRSGEGQTDPGDRPPASLSAADRPLASLDAAGLLRPVWTDWAQSRPLESGQRHSMDGAERVVLPVADREDLAQARIACMGERLLDFIEARLGQVPGGVSLDEALVRTLVPLGAWFAAFLGQKGQVLNGNNWLDRATHLRRLTIPSRVEVFTAGHFGRTCPFESPEGPNVGRILTVSRGAEIRDGQLVIVDDSPIAGLGLAAACVPFLEHDDGNRVLMGVNMMRQALPPNEREPALVQTGLEPEGVDYWYGRNLLTAFVSWDGDAFEDALVVSESAARKLACPEPLEPGDKLSNRHGTKGVVSRVLPDDRMPRMPDGAPLELILSVSGVPSRWNVGQLREAALSRVAYAEGKPALVRPFEAPADEELRQRLRDAGLPDTGMVTLTDGGEPLRRACTAGWVYWGCLTHLARTKMHTALRPEDRPQRVGRMEVQALREAGAEAVIGELTNTASSEREDAAGLADRVAAGPIEPARTPSPRFAALTGKLARAGVRAEAGDGEVTFALGDLGNPGGLGDTGGGETGLAHELALVEPVPHPWLPDRQVQAVWVSPETGGNGAAPGRAGQVADANLRLARLLESGAPDVLVRDARAGLAGAVQSLYDMLLSPEDLAFGTWALFSGRTVLTPGPDLALDQIGLPEEMSWNLYGPQVAAQLGDTGAVEKRTEPAAAALAEVMASSWLILNRAPSVGPTSLLAFHPLAVPQRAIRLHPLACRLLNADFDGDQAAVYLPLTVGAQREAGERLSIAGHLQRDPDLIDELFPSMDALFGLACLSRSEEGQQALAGAVGEASELAGHIPAGGILTRDGVVGILRQRLEAQGPRAALALAQGLMHLGFAAARREGGSVGPFVGATVDLPETPASDDPDQWQAYMEEVWGLVAHFREYDDADLGAVCLLSHSGARATASQVAALCAPGGLVHDVDGDLVVVRGCWRTGLSPTEALARVVGARRGLYRVQEEYAALGQEHEARSRPTGHGVLARARRADRPGVVFARAAARGEVDPLTDEYARLFVGLPPAAS